MIVDSTGILKSECGMNLLISFGVGRPARGGNARCGDSCVRQLFVFFHRKRLDQRRQEGAVTSCRGKVNRVLRRYTWCPVSARGIQIGNIPVEWSV